MSQQASDRWGGTGRRLFIALSVAVLLGLGSTQAVQADVIVDGRLNGTDDLTLTGLDTEILAEYGTLRGTSLIHALRKLGVEAEGSATFRGPDSGAPVERVISVVTGCELGCEGPTQIDGRLALAAEIFSADFYLIDPNGVVFGEGASLDMGGAVTVSTADSVEMGAADNVLEASDPGAWSTLTAAAPSAFGFLDAPESIVVEGAQIDLPGPVALIGGDLTISGTRSDEGFGYVATEAERIDFVSLASAGRVGLDAAVGQAPDVQAAAFGRIEMTDRAAVSSSGLSPGAAFSSTPPPIPARGAGDIFIRGGEFVIEDAARVQSTTVTYEAGGDIEVDLSGDLMVRGLGSGLFAASGFVTDPLFEGTTTLIDRLNLEPSSPDIIEVERSFDGPFCAPGSCRVSYGGDFAFLVPDIARDLGPAGNIRVSAENVSIVEGGRLSSTSFFGGPAGTIDVQARGDVTITGAPDRFEGSYDLIRGGLFSNTQRGGEGGEITIGATELEIDDFGAVVTELREGSGTAGQVEIAVDRLRIAGNGRVDTSTRGVGNAGDILVDVAESISISDAISDEEFSGISSLSQPEAAGDAGSIRVSAPEIDVLDGARISTRAFGGGDAGEIDVRFSDRMAIIGGAIEASAEQALGGNIQLDSGRVTALADGTLAMEPYSGPVGESLVLQDASITTSVGSGTGLGGNVGIQADEVLLVRSAITADADESNAGNIRIAADRFIRDDTSIVRASSNKAEDGIVEIIAPESVLIPPLVELPSRFLDVTSLLRDICARGDAGGGSLVVLGADGVPTGPETLLQAPIRLAEGVTPSGDGQPALAQVWPVYGADPFGGFEWCRSGAR